jgi:hypothetical protein
MSLRLDDNVERALKGQRAPGREGTKFPLVTAHRSKSKKRRPETLICALCLMERVTTAFRAYPALVTCSTVMPSSCPNPWARVTISSTVLESAAKISNVFSVFLWVNPFASWYANRLLAQSIPQRKKYCLTGWGYMVETRVALGNRSDRHLTVTD